ncbi:MAG: xylulokinase [Paracoccaceae bacterium]
MSYLGVDLGTSGIRLLLTDDDGNPLASTERPLTVARPHPGWAEQDPAAWVMALDGAIDELRAAHPAFGGLKAIAVAGHMHGATLLDEVGTPVRPCILWNDTRSHAEASQMDALPVMRAQSGNIVFPGFTAPKLEWVRRNEPEVFARTARVLLPAAFLGLYLSGAYFSDRSDASGTSWLDVQTRDWSPDLLAAGAMRPDQMPRLVDGCQPAATLRPELAARWGLAGDVVIAGGAGDNAAAACGIGALAEGQGFVSLGTSGVLLVARDGCHPRPETAIHTFCHAVPGRWYQMGVMLSATDSLNWLSRLCGHAPAALVAALGQSLRKPGRTRFYPYLAGERTPHNDAAIRGAFTGLEVATDTQDLTHAVLEGVAFGLRDSAEALRAAGAPLAPLYAIGGGAASDYWLRLLATILDVPLLRPQSAEFGAAFGAARLARIAATGLPPESVIVPPEACERIEPDARLRPSFEAGYQAFREAYGTLRALP